MDPGGLRRHSAEGRLTAADARPVDVWDVLGKRTAADEWTLVGGVKAPDVGMALLLARETHFRHKEGVAYAVRRRGDPADAVHVGPDSAETLGGVTDHSYRRLSQFKRHFGGANRVYSGAHDLYSYDRIADAMLPFLQHLAVEEEPACGLAP